MKKISRQPKIRLCITVLVVTATSVGAVIERDQFYARRKASVAVDLFNLGPHPRYDVIGV